MPGTAAWGGFAPGRGQRPPCPQEPGLLPGDDTGLGQVAGGELMLNGKIIGHLSTEIGLVRLLRLPRARSQGRFV